MSTARVELLPHRDAWRAEFLALAARVRGALGAAALRIDHIGSTAVPGLPAKDVIDLQVTLAALDDAPLARLAAAGFVPRGQRQDAPPPGAGWSETDARKHLFAEPAGTRRAHLHVRVQGRPNQRVPLLMRDFLRADAGSAAAYGEFKRRLAAAVPASDRYAETKDPVFHLMIGSAERWSALTGWQVGDGDA